MAPDPSLRAGLEHLLNALKLIEASAAWARDYSARSPSSHGEFIREANEDWARYEAAKAAVADLLRAQPPVETDVETVRQVLGADLKTAQDRVLTLELDNQRLRKIVWLATSEAGQAQPPPAPDPRTCQWALDDVDGDAVYETQCGHSFQFNDGGATENEFRFCGYCGGQIVDARTSEDMAAPPAVEGTRPVQEPG